MPRNDGPGAWGRAEAGGDQVCSGAFHDTTSGGPKTVPAVSETDTLDDRVWFGQHSARVFRSRRAAHGGIWIVRRSGDALLRVRAAPLSPLRDTDGELGPLWFASAWPLLSAEKAQQLGRRAARRGRRRGQ